MKNFRKGLLLTAFLLSSMAVSAQNNDSTSVGSGSGFNNNINSQSSNPNSAVVAPMYCQNRVMTWTVNGNRCSGTATQTNEGSSRTVASGGVNTGSATYTCSNNNFTNQRSATCEAPISCQSRTIAWRAENDITVCTGTISQTNNGASRTVISTNGGNTGSTTFTCSGDTFINQRNTICIRGSSPGGGCAINHMHGCSNPPNNGGNF